jgi:glycine betaine/proline transport system substrate-binding protein
MKLIRNMIATVSTVVVMSSAANAADLVVGEPNWPSARATAYVLASIIENDMGYDVDIVPGSNEVIFAGMDRGKGDIDVHPNTWVPNHSHLHQKYIDEAGSVFMSENSYQGTSGYFAPRYFSEEYGVTSIFDLTNPEITKLLDRDGDGKGDVWFGALGWSSTNVELVKARDYGYAELITPSMIDENLIIAELDRYYSDKKPYLMYFYSPHWLFSKYDMIQLEEPPHGEDCWTMVQPKDDVEWFEKSSVSCAWPATSGAIAFSSRLKNQLPDVAEFLERADVTGEMAAEWSYALSVDKRDAEEYAKEWIDANRDVVGIWLNL